MDVYNPLGRNQLDNFWENGCQLEMGAASRLYFFDMWAAAGASRHSALHALLFEGDQKGVNLSQNTERGSFVLFWNTYHDHISPHSTPWSTM